MSLSPKNGGKLCWTSRRDLRKLRVEEKSYGFRLVSPRDGEGHGDTFSAFALALLIAHELAGKKPMLLTPSCGDNSYAAAFNARLAEYELEQQMFAKEDDDPSGLLDAIRDGRVQVFGHGNLFG